MATFTDEQKLAYIKTSFIDAIASIGTLAQAETLITNITPGQLKAMITGKLSNYKNNADDIIESQGILKDDLTDLITEIQSW